MKNISNLSEIDSSLEYEFKCEKCGSIVQKQKTALKRNPYLLCKKCLMLKKYGVTSNCQKKEVSEKISKKKQNFSEEKLNIILEKRKSTNLKKYGVESFQQSKEYKETRNKTIIDKYGSLEEYYNIIKEKSKQTCLEKYGVDTPFKSKEIMEKSYNTRKEKYGYLYPLQDKNISKKVVALKRERYGEHYEDIVSKTKKTKLEKYKNENYNNQEKLIITNQERYGVNHQSQRPEIMKKIVSSSRTSTLELCFEQYLINHNIQYEKSFVLKGHIFDFAIFKKELFMLVDCDGQYWHCRKNNEYAYKQEKEYIDFLDARRTSLIPNNIKFIVIFEETFKEDLEYFLKNYSSSYEDYIKEIEDFVFTLSFPYPKYNKLELNNNAIRHFHKSMYHAHVNGKPSPFEAWHNKELMKKLIKNRLFYIDNVRPDKLLNGLSVSKIAPRVSLFSSNLAERLIKQYLNKYNEIFDPCSGFSGRMIGSVRNNKNYIGYDIHPDHIKESNEIISFFNLNSKVFLKDSLNESGEFESLFTCPPYGNKEIYGYESKILSSDKWISYCLENFKCNSYLFVVNDTELFKNYIVEELKITSHFGTVKEYIILK